MAFKFFREQAVGASLKTEVFEAGFEQFPKGKPVTPVTECGAFLKAAAECKSQRGLNSGGNTDIVRPERYGVRGVYF